MSRFRGWSTAVALTCIVVVSAAAGWVLSGLITRERPTVTAEQTLPPEQAKQQACNAFKVASRQWLDAYREWLPVVSTPGWQWSDRAVQDATTRFSAAEAEIVTQLTALIPQSTPTDVAKSLHNYTNALLEYSAGHGQAGQADMDGQVNTIDDAADDVGTACAA